MHNIYAYGQSRVLVDDNTGKMYCGKRCDKVDKKRHTETYAWEMALDACEKETRKTAKEQRKEEMNHLCASVELQKISLIGNMLQFYGHQYTICPKCGNMKYNPNHMYDGFYCGCCMENGHLFRTIRYPSGVSLVSIWRTYRSVERRSRFTCASRVTNLGFVMRLRCWT